MKKNANAKKAIVIFGPPGSGKGTQASLTASKFGLFNFDTGKFVDRLVHDSANLKNKEIQVERKNYDGGILMTPSFILKFVTKRVGELYRDGEGVVFSGSPRTYFEAFGDKKNVGLVKTLEKLYGQKNVFYFLIEIPEKESIRRNSQRTLCSVCGTQLLSILNFRFKKCPFCGGNLRKRKDDNPVIIKKRLNEYKQRTTPVINGLRERGYKINVIDGTKMPYKVFESISKKIDGPSKK